MVYGKRKDNHSDSLKNLVAKQTSTERATFHDTAEAKKMLKELLNVESGLYDTEVVFIDRQSRWTGLWLRWQYEKMLRIYKRVM
ncbi:MAG: hypothetical protein KAS32_03260 [Candidatus Peribacteraceae bacterium]|nr:hypothetical protein [Candidatus Peribacteraceae bacterium]